MYLLHFGTMGADIVEDELEILVFGIDLVEEEWLVDLDQIPAGIRFYGFDRREGGVRRASRGGQEPCPHGGGIARRDAYHRRNEPDCLGLLHLFLELPAFDALLVHRIENHVFPV